MTRRIFAPIVLSFSISLGGPAALFANPSSQDVLKLGGLNLGTQGGGCWGYVKDGREYAVMGQGSFTHFVDVTKPSNPVVVASIAGATSAWHEIKRFGDYIYVSSEATAGMQIIDISNASNPTLVRTWNTTFTNAHSIFVDTTAARLYAVGTSSGMRILNLAANPSNPTDIGSYNPYYIHDLYVRNNVAYAGAIGAGALKILNVTNAAAVSQIASVAYPGGATHNAWPSEDGAHCFTTDETSGGHIRVWDITTLSSPIQVGEAFSWDPSAIVHNVVVKGDSLYSAYYTAGFTLHNIEDPTNPVLVGWYDTSPAFSGGIYKGAWGAYPFYPSGTVVVSNIGEGLSVLRPCGKLNHEDGWPLALSGGMAAGATLADLDGDGASEVIVASRDDSVHVFTGAGADFAGWPRGTGGDVTATPAVGDLSGDGDLEIVVGSADGNLWAWEHNGAVVAGWPVALGAAVEATAALADLDGDGALEAVVAGGSQLHVIGAAGAEKAGFPVAVAGSVGARGVAVGDLDGDGAVEIVQATSSTLHAFRANGAAQPGWPKASAGATSSLRRAPILADLDGDSDLEVVIGGGSGGGVVEAYHGDGAAVAGWPKATSAECGGAIAAGDLDADGAPEVVAVAANGQVHAWRADGGAVAGWPQGGTGSLGSAPLLADLDGDGGAEVFVATADSVLRVYRGSGAPYYPCHPDLRESVEGAIALGASDVDGHAEIYIPEREGRVMGFSLHDVAPPVGRRDWPAYRFGNRRLGVRENTFPGGAADVPLGNGGARVVWDSVRAEGTTQVRVDPVGSPAPDPAYRAFGDSVVHLLTSTAAASDSFLLTLAYDATGLTPAQENAIVMLALQGGAWSDVTASRDVGANTVTGRGGAKGTFGLFLLDPTGVESRPAGAALAFRLGAASPNPTGGGGVFRFALPVASRARLDLFDVSGARVRSLVDAVLPPGEHEVAWDGRSASGGEVASGVYIYRLEAGPHSATRKLAVVK